MRWPRQDFRNHTHFQSLLAHGSLIRFTIFPLHKSGEVVSSIYYFEINAGTCWKSTSFSWIYPHWPSVHFNNLYRHFSHGIDLFPQLKHFKNSNKSGSLCLVGDIRKGKRKHLLKSWDCDMIWNQHRDLSARLNPHTHLPKEQVQACWVHRKGIGWPCFINGLIKGLS